MKTFVITFLICGREYKSGLLEGEIGIRNEADFSSWLLDSAATDGAYFSFTLENGGWLTLPGYVIRKTAFIIEEVK